MSVAWALAAVATASLTAGCGPRWPTVNAIYHSEFAADPGRVATVDVLPADIDVAVADGMNIEPFQITETINHTVAREALDELQEMGYRVKWIDWRGRYYDENGRGQAMDAQAVRDTADSLYTYGETQHEATAEGHNGSLVPHLPARLGDGTGSDATLYVGGRAFVGKRPTTPGEEAAKTFVIITFVAVLAIVVIAIAASASEGSGGSGKSKRTSGKGARSKRGSGGRL